MAEVIVTINNDDNDGNETMMMLVVMIDNFDGNNDDDGDKACRRFYSRHLTHSGKSSLFRRSSYEKMCYVQLDHPEKCLFCEYAP